MPSYKVKEVGFHGGKLYDPKGPRSTLTIDKPLKPVPKWLEPIKELSPQQKAAAIKAQKKAEESAKNGPDFSGTDENVVETL